MTRAKTPSRSPAANYLQQTDRFDRRSLAGLPVSIEPVEPRCTESVDYYVHTPNSHD